MAVVEDGKTLNPASFLCHFQSDESAASAAAGVAEV